MVSRGDIIALQHDAGPASLLRCQSPPHSMWGQPVFALNQSEWFWINNTGQTTDASAPQLDLQARVEGGEGGWLEEVVCPIRLLYVGHSETPLEGPQLSAGLPRAGLYSLLVIHHSCFTNPSMQYLNSRYSVHTG